MYFLRRYVSLLVFLAAVLFAAGCSSGTESVSVSQRAQPTSTSTPATAPTVPPTSAPTATAEVELTAVPVEPTPVPTLVSTPAPAEPTAVSEQATVEASNSEPTVPTSEPERPPERGLLAEQFCVVDIVAPDTLNARSGPSVGDAIVATLDEGQCGVYPTGSVDGSWVQVAIVDLASDEIVGWVSGNFIAPLRAPADPDAPTQVITISVQYGLDSPESETTLDAFRLSTDGLVVGSLDANGQITVPVDLDLSRVRISAEFANDKYCAWTGELRSEGADGRYSSFLMALCA